MVNNDPLTQREFDIWRESDTEFKQRLETHLIAQETLNRDSEARLRVIEHDHDRMMTKSGWIATIISGFTGTIVHFFLKRLGY